MKNKNNFLTLAIETSCDETCAAVVDSKLNVLSNVVSSQIDIHKLYGGVVPEVASRNHLLAVENVTSEALKEANVAAVEINQIVATTQPGLVGAVMVGRVFAESMAVALDLSQDSRNELQNERNSFVGINHLLGHIASVKLSNKELKPPFVTLVVSGGHTSLYLVTEAHNDVVDAGGWSVRLIEATTDDACGEAFDKVAKVLGLEYPGGPQIAKQAESFLKSRNNQVFINFVEKRNHKRTGFSYSGLKTAVLNYVNRKKQMRETLDLPLICASFQHEAVEQLVVKSIAVLKNENIKTLCVCGGVSANQYLREKMKEACSLEGARLFLPELKYCGDNAAMIGAAAILKLHL